MIRVPYSLKKGFTLIELLIVIVIIGILAGVVIGVLNPVQQQNRARDGTLRSSLSKMALSTKSLQVSATRATYIAPTGSEFAAGIGNIDGLTCAAGVLSTPATSGLCTFTISGISNPATCAAAGGYNGTGTNPCFFGYYRVANLAGDNGFRLAAKGHANPIQLFVYEFLENPSGSVNEGFYACDISAGGAYNAITGILNNAGVLPANCIRS